MLAPHWEILVDVKFSANLQYHFNQYVQLYKSFPKGMFTSVLCNNGGNATVNVLF